MTVETLSSLEIASGAVIGVLPRRADTAGMCPIGREGGGSPDCDAERPRDVRAALEEAILPALLQAPCLVSFSGGRDSSAVLAVAVQLARREGLAAPIPVTNVFPAAPETCESSWQQRLISHLGLSEWVRIEHANELDLVGPYAQRVLGEQGLVWPPNVHFHLPLIDASKGGSLLTGIGGDELFLAARTKEAPGRRALVLLHPRELARTALARAPVSLRRLVVRRRRRIEAAWLRARARREISEILAHQAAAQPASLSERMAWWRRMRYLHVGIAALERTAERPGVMLLHPLLCAGVWSAVADSAAPSGFAGRTEAMHRLFGDLLPPPLLTRSSKARFDAAFWTARAAAFAHDWDGRGAPEEWVDGAKLERHWQDERPSAQSFTLLQSLWLQSVHEASGEAWCPPRARR